MRRPCIYASKKLKGAELHYSATEGECQTVLWAVKLFRPYVYGSLFELQTDHFALKWLMTCKDLQGKLARWSLKLQAYNMVVVHKRGRLNRNVDALSRAEICPAKYMSELASSLYDLDTDSESGSDAPENWNEGEGSDDSMDELTEAERIQFLEARDLFINAECQRLALLEVEQETGTTVTGRILYISEGENDELRPEDDERDPETDWLEAAELRYEEEEDSLQEPDWVCQLRHDLECDWDDHGAKVVTGVDDEQAKDLLDQEATVDRETGEFEGLVEQDAQAALTEDEVLAEYLRSLTDVEIHDFLAKQAEGIICRGKGQGEKGEQAVSLGCRNADV